MRIAMIGQKGIPAIYGGVEQHVQDLSVRLVKFGHEVTAYSRKWYSNQRKQDFNGVRIRFMPCVHSKHFDTITHTLISTMDAIFRGFDVIHYHGVGPALLSWMPRIFAPQTKVIVTFHSIDRYHQKWGWFAKLILRIGEWSACNFPHKTIVVSKGLQNYCLNEYKTEATYIPNGFNAKQEKYNDKWIARFGLANNQYMVMISRLVPHKGAHILIEAFKQFKNEQSDNQLKLAIVGGSVHTDDYCAALKEAAKEQEDIVFTNFQSGKTLEALYANAAVLIHPSFNEGLPMTVLQAMAMGRPILLSAIEAHMEMSKNSEIFFKENNVQDLKQKLVEFCSWTEEKKNELGEQNARVAIENYDWENIALKTANLYAENTATEAELKKAKEALAA